MAAKSRIAILWLPNSLTGSLFSFATTNTAVPDPRLEVGHPAASPARAGTGGIVATAVPHGMAGLIPVLP